MNMFKWLSFNERGKFSYWKELYASWKSSFDGEWVCRSCTDNVLHEELPDDAGSWGFAKGRYSYFHSIKGPASIAYTHVVHRDQTYLALCWNIKEDDDSFRVYIDEFDDGFLEAWRAKKKLSHDRNVHVYDWMVAKKIAVEQKFKEKRQRRLLFEAGKREREFSFVILTDRDPFDGKRELPEDFYVIDLSEHEEEILTDGYRGPGGKWRQGKKETFSVVSQVSIDLNEELIVDHFSFGERPFIKGFDLSPLPGSSMRFSLKSRFLEIDALFQSIEDEAKLLEDQKARDLQIKEDEQRKEEEERETRRRAAVERFEKHKRNSEQSIFSYCPGIQIIEHVNAPSTIDLVAGGVVAVEREHGRGYDYKVIIMWSLTTLYSGNSIRLYEAEQDGQMELLHLITKKYGCIIDDTKGHEYKFDHWGNNRPTESPSGYVFTIKTDDLDFLDVSVLEKVEPLAKNGFPYYGNEDWGTWVEPRGKRGQMPRMFELGLDYEIEILPQEEYAAWYRRAVNLWVSDLVDGKIQAWGNEDPLRVFSFGEFYSGVPGEFEFKEIPQTYRSSKPFIFVVGFQWLGDKFIVNHISTYEDRTFTITRHNQDGSTKLVNHNKTTKGGWFDSPQYDSETGEYVRPFHYVFDYDNGRFTCELDYIDVYGLNRAEEELRHPPGARGVEEEDVVDEEKEDFKKHQGENIFEEKPLEELIEEAMIAAGGRGSLSNEMQQDIEQKVRSQYARRKRKRQRYERTKTQI